MTPNPTRAVIVRAAALRPAHVLLVLAVLACAPSARAQTPPRAGTPITSGDAPAAVINYWGRSIATLRASVGAMDPVERRDAAQQRMDRLPATVRPTDVTVDTARVGDFPVALLTVNGQVLFGIFDADLDPGAGETVLTAANQARVSMQAALQARADSHQVPLLVRGIVFSLLASAALALAFMLLNRLARRLADLAGREASTRADKALGKVNVGSMERLARNAIYPLAWLAGAMLTYVWLTFVFEQFPYTQVWGEQLGGFLWAIAMGILQNVIAAVPGVIATIGIFIAARLLTQGSAAVFGAVERGRLTIPGLHPDTAEASHRILVCLIWLFALIASYRHIPGSQTEAFKAVGVLSGLVVSLGSVGLINQVMSGLVVVYARALKRGEFIRAGQIHGTVQDVGLLATKLITPLREEVTIPNTVLITGEVTNYSRLASEHGAIVGTRVTIGYNAPWRLVHAMLLRAASATARVLAEPKPYVLQSALNDFAVSYELRVTIARPAERFLMLSELHTHIQDEFNANGIQIMTPAFEGQPEEAVLVPKPKWNPELQSSDPPPA